MHWIHCIQNAFTVQHLWTTCTCPEKQSFPWTFSLYWLYTFYIQDFWATCACPEKECTLNSLVECIVFIIQDFLATCACSEKQSCPENFHCFEIFFIIQEFWGTCACPENRVCPEIFHCIEIFFTIQEFWATCACPENRICPEIFQAGGDASPLPRTPVGLVRLCVEQWLPKWVVPLPWGRSETLGERWSRNGQLGGDTQLIITFLLSY